MYNQFIGVTIACFLTGCSSLGNFADRANSGSFSNEASSNLIKQSQIAADKLSEIKLSEAQLRDTRGQEPNPPLVIMTSLVNANDFLYSSTLGNTVSEIIGGKLATNGIPVKEIRLRGNILVRGNHGEMMLSRQFKEVAKEHTADAVVVGTYAEAAESVLISTKMISLDDEHVISAHNFSVRKTSDIAALLHGVREEDRYPDIANEDANGEPVEDASNAEDAPKTLMDSVREYDTEVNKRRLKNKNRNL